MHPSRLIAVSIALLAASCGIADAELSIDDALASDELALASQNSSVGGSLSATGVSWVSHPLSLSTPGELTITLQWANAAANLNLFFYGPDGTLLSSARSTTAKPETLTVKVSSPGTHRVGIKAASGSTSYTLSTAFTPAYVETAFSGQCSASGTSWVTHPFEANPNETIDATLSWSTASANLNLFVSDPAGVSVGLANGTTARPEIVRAAATVSGTFQAGIKCKTGASSYTLTVRRTPGQPVTPPAPAYPGKPAAGKLYWGAAVQGNMDPVARHEAPTGAALGVHRTFFQWNERTGKLVTTARDDLAKGRLPWVSVKTPSWAEMAAGTHDAEIDQLLNAIDALDGPVWLTFHHEPEGGGGSNTPDDPAGPAGHVAMNKQVRARMKALGTTNVALAPILMSYTFKTASGRNPDAWFAPGIYDFIGIDHYRDAEASLVEASWATIRTWAAARKLDLAVGEWGMRGTDAAAGARVREWFDMAAGSGTDGKGARVVGLSAFDSGLNSPSGSWELTGAQLTSFHSLLTDPRAAHP